MAGAASATDELTICYNYDCASTAIVSFGDSQLNQIALFFHSVTDSASERSAVSLAIGQFEVFAGQQTPTWVDRGGNYADDGMNGRMDCLDHSHNTTLYLQLMVDHGWIRFHRVLERQMRAPFSFDTHWSAVIEETQSGQKYAVDSWFFDNGKPAVIFTLEDWLAGANPADAH